MKTMKNFKIQILLKNLLLIFIVMWILLICTISKAEYKKELLFTIPYKNPPIFEYDERYGNMPIWEEMYQKVNTPEGEKLYLMLSAMKVDSQGYVYLAAHMENKIIKFSQKGEFIREYNFPTSTFNFNIDEWDNIVIWNRYSPL